MKITIKRGKKGTRISFKAESPSEGVRLKVALLEATEKNPSDLPMGIVNALLQGKDEEASA